MIVGDQKTVRKSAQVGSMMIDRSFPSPKIGKVEVYFRVLHALLLRDMRTRFGGSHVGYVVAVLWPVVHVLVVVSIVTFRGLTSPMNGGTALFVATGAVPTLVFQYISREVMKGYAANKPLIYYPQVKIFDVIVARVIVEVVSGFIGAIIVLSVLVAFGSKALPEDAFQAIAAYFAAVLLGISIGIVNVGIVVFFPAWQLGYIFLTIVNYMVVGVYFMPSLLPENIYYYMSFHPLVQIIQWMRKSYEPGLAVEVDHVYIFLWITVSLSLGLFFERFFARKEA